MSDSLPELFARALELDRPGREGLLADLEGRDPALAQELREVLAGADAPHSALDLSPWSELDLPPTAGNRLPERIGDYRILRELGRGGMGRVYLAEEKTEDFCRTVALKVIDRSRSLDAVDDVAVRRFRDEVRILSSLEHPGIARFLGGGRIPDGTWFLALEHVQGEEITAYAAARSLSIRERIELLVVVLEPIRYAHQRGVIHRDLKPGHLLIDSAGNPRLLDFGISKLVDSEAPASVAVTRTESRAFTPAYASPEQYRGEPATPASDVYALGVVLYELLAGKRPFADATGNTLERAVLEHDPDPPSTAARRTPRAEKAPDAPTRPPRRGELGRDLDAICLKALRKRPEERYPDAGALAEDLRSYLDGRPVRARRGGLRYRLGRALHRHRGGLVTTAAILLAGGAAVVAWRAERQMAELRPVEPAPAPFPFSDATQIPLDDLERRFAAQPANAEAGATLVLGLIRSHRLDEAKLMLSRLRQIPGEAENPLTDYVDALLSVDLEEPQRGLVLYTQARDRAIAQGRGELVAQARAARGRLLSTMGEREAGIAEMELARRDFEIAGDHASLSSLLNILAIEQFQQGRFDEGEVLLRQGIEEGRLGKASITFHLNNLAQLEAFRGRPDLAEEHLRESAAILRQSDNRRERGATLSTLAIVLVALGRMPEAESTYEEALGLLRTDGDPAILRTTLFARAFFDINNGRQDRLQATIEELEQRGVRAGDYNATAMPARVRADWASLRGDVEQMRRQYELARRLLLENGDTDQAADVDASETLAEWRAGNPEIAARLAEQTLGRLPAEAKGSDPVLLASTILVRVDAAAGRHDAARSRLATLDSETASSPAVSRRMQYLGARAAIATAERRFDDARRDLELAVAAAVASGQKLEELYFRLDLARLTAQTDASEAIRLAAAVAGEATALRLRGLAEAARAGGSR